MAERNKSLPIVGARGALERLSSGDSASVIAELNAALAADPDDAIAFLRLGAVYLAIGHFPEAATRLGRAVELDGDDVQGRLLYADVLSRLKRYDAAAFQLVQARRLAPLDARVHRQLGIVFFDKGLHQKALDSLAHASALDPTDARSSFVMGLIHDARRDPAGAIGHYRRALAIDPGLVDARCTLADALATMGEIAEAARELEQAQRQDRTSTRIAQNLELLRRGLRDLEAQRLLGQTEAEVERSTLVKQGQLKRKGTVRSGDGTAVRYGSPAFELWVHGSSERIEKLCFLLLDPEKSSLERDDAFEVIVVAQDGRSERADLATAATLTFLREALGCPLTRASEIYRQLLSDPRPVAWAGADVGFVEVELDGRVFIALAVSVGA